jgi:flagellar hook assembly protein FlgD
MKLDKKGTVIEMADKNGVNLQAGKFNSDWSGRLKKGGKTHNTCRESAEITVKWEGGSD